MLLNFADELRRKGWGGEIGPRREAPVLLSPEAASDLDEIKQWVAAEGGPKSALYLMRSLLKAVRLLAQRPELGHTHEDLSGLPLKFWPVFSYLIVYDPARIPGGGIRRGRRSERVTRRAGP